MKSPGQERREVVTRLTEAADILSASMEVRFVPYMGANIAFAITGARDGRDVAAVPGGLRVDGGRIQRSGLCAFDTGEEFVRTVLTVMKFDPAMRSVAVIAYSREFLDVCADMFIECRELDRTRSAPGTSAMDWGIASCCSDGVPEVIYDKGTKEENGMICCIGEDAVGVANNIIILIHRIQ
jgi:predicted fused transcriptional regulator/phosphomethylpyrimidine kinase